MKRLLIASLLGSIAFAASAQPPSTDAAATAAASSNAQANAAVQVETQTRAEPDAATTYLDTRSQVQKDADVDCIRETGTRITTRRNKDQDCVGANGRVYSRSDLERTGEIDVADALRKLDPSVR